MMRPTCASVYSLKPAKTSAMRLNIAFCSSDSVSHGSTSSVCENVPSGIGFSGVSSVSSGRMPFSFIRSSTHSRYAS
ncbi:hypothetical protein D3C87_1872600 [compost metagenome]